MATIWKYVPAQPGDLDRYRVPAGARIVSVSPVTGCLYLEVDPNEPHTARLDVATVRTGGEAPSYPGMKYIGLWHDGPFVWHAYAEVVP